MLLNETNLKDHLFFKKLFSREYFVYFMIFACFIKNVCFFKFGRIPMIAISIYAFILLIYWLLFDRTRILSKNKILEVLLILSSIISCFVNSFVGIYRDFTIFVSMIIAFFVLANVSKKDDIEKEIKNSSLLVMILSFIYSALSLVFYIIQDSERFSGFTTVDIFSEMLLTFLGVSVFCFMFFDDKKIRVFSTFNFVFQFVLVFLNQQRTGVFGAIIAMVFLIIFFIYKIPKQYLPIDMKYIKVILALFLLIFVLVFVFSKSNVNLLFIKIFRFSENARLQLIEVGIATLLSHNVLFGMSSGAMGIYMLDYLNKNASYYLEGLHKVESTSYYAYGYVHNIYLFQLLAHGVVGLILLVLYIIKVFRNYLLLFKIPETNKFIISFIASSFFVLIAHALVGMVSMNVLFGFAFIPNIIFFQYCGYILLNKEKIEISQNV